MVLIKDNSVEGREKLMQTETRHSRTRNSPKGFLNIWGIEVGKEVNISCLSMISQNIFLITLLVQIARSVCLHFTPDGYLYKIPLIEVDLLIAQGSMYHSYEDLKSDSRRPCDLSLQLQRIPLASVSTQTHEHTLTDRQTYI